MATSISIRLAGTLEVRVDGLAIRDALGPLGRVALAYLVVERRRAVARDELADVLWGEDLPATWTSALRGVVGRIRASFASAGLDGPALISRKPAATGCACLPGRSSIRKRPPPPWRRPRPHSNRAPPTERWRAQPERRR